MTVLEVGIFRKSVLILHKSFYPLKKVMDSMNVQKRSTIISQIQKMAELVVKGNLKVIDNEYYRIYFSLSPEYPEIFIYAIDDKKSSQNIVQSLLNKLLLKFQQFYPKNRDIQNVERIDSTQLKQFSSIIEKTLADERYTPLDRIKNFLL